MNLAPPTVFVVDDDLTVGDSVRWLLQSIGVDVRTFDSAQAFLDANISCTYGCLVLDVRMQNLSGLQLQQILCERNFSLPIIFLSAYGDAQMGAQAVKRGALDFLQKPYRNQDLIDAVNFALKVSREVAEQANEKGRHLDCLQRLSEREREILRLVADGNSSKVIARMLGISHKTVEAHRARLTAKFGVKSSTALGYYAAVLDSKNCQTCKWPAMAMSPDLAKASCDVAKIGPKA